MTRPNRAFRNRRPTHRHNVSGGSQGRTDIPRPFQSEPSFFRGFPSYQASFDMEADTHRLLSEIGREVSNEVADGLTPSRVLVVDSLAQMTEHFGAFNEAMNTAFAGTGEQLAELAEALIAADGDFQQLLEPLSVPRDEWLLLKDIPSNVLNLPVGMKEKLVEWGEAAGQDVLLRNASTLGYMFGHLPSGAFSDLNDHSPITITHDLDFFIKTLRDLIPPKPVTDEEYQERVNAAFRSGRKRSMDV